MAANEHNNATDRRTLFVVRAGARLFAIFAEEVEATAGDLTPTPLPFAPHAIRGVVSLHGRIRTVIDPLRLPDANLPAVPDATSSISNSTDSDPSSRDSSSPNQTSPHLFVALAGDEQLALACDAAEEQFEIDAAHITPPADPRSHARGTIERDGERVTLLDPARLFNAATLGTERRRKRS